MQNIKHKKIIYSLLIFYAIASVIAMVWLSILVTYNALHRPASIKLRTFTTNDLYICKTGDTGSMLPGLTGGATDILLHVKDTNDLQVGDVITFRIPSGGSRIHRISSIGRDEKGWFCRTKGDNTMNTDPWIIRSDNIDGVLVGVMFSKDDTGNMVFKQ